MNALYQIRYRGIAGVSHGAIHICRGAALGFDIFGGRYAGSYAEPGGNLTGQFVLTTPGGPLVVGRPRPVAGTQIPINFVLPPDLGNGQFQTVTIAGYPAQIAFDKIGDVPSAADKLPAWLRRRFQ